MRSGDGRRGRPGKLTDWAAWRFSWGADAEGLALAHLEDGEEPPEICCAPEVSPGLSPYIAAFTDLQGDRPVGLAPGPIPTTAILAYAKEVEEVTNPEDLRFFLRAVRAIDGAWLTADAQGRKAREKG